VDLLPQAPSKQCQPSPEEIVVLLRTMASLLQEQDEKAANFVVAPVDRDVQLAEKDAQIAGKDLEIAGQIATIASLRGELSGVYNSRSWKVTRPLRFARRISSNWVFLAGKKFSSLAVIFLKFTLSLLPDECAFSIKRYLKKCYAMIMLGNPLEVFELRKKATWNVNKFRKCLNAARGKTMLIIEASMPWSYALFQRPQQLALALGQLGYFVIYKQHQFPDGAANVADNIWIVDAGSIEGPPNAVRIFMSTFDYPPSYFRRVSSGDIIIYDYIDHIDEKISGGYRIAKLHSNKAIMFRDADIVTASAKALYDEAKASSAAEVVMLQNGVDTRHYFSFTRMASPPSRLASFLFGHKKIVGYFGAMAPWLDYDLINAVIALRKDLGFVFIGPDYADSLHRLAQADNCLLLDAMDYTDLPNYALWFDICWIPFEPGDIAKSTSPLKLFEYFALGKPVVVATDMLECIHFPLVFNAKDATEFSERIDEAIRVAAHQDTEERLKQLAVENSWLVRAGSLSSAIQKVMATRTGEKCNG
jgi:glycosyltransferase involved in cell wall biosynthesis